MSCAFRGGGRKAGEGVLGQEQKKKRLEALMSMVYTELGAVKRVKRGVRSQTSRQG